MLRLLLVTVGWWFMIIIIISLSFSAGVVERGVAAGCRFALPKASESASNRRILLPPASIWHARVKESAASANRCNLCPCLWSPLLLSNVCFAQRALATKDTKPAQQCPAGERKVFVSSLNCVMMLTSFVAKPLALPRCKAASAPEIWNTRHNSTSVASVHSQKTCFRPFSGGAPVCQLHWCGSGAFMHPIGLSEGKPFGLITLVIVVVASSPFNIRRAGVCGDSGAPSARHTLSTLPSRTSGTKE